MTIRTMLCEAMRQRLAPLLPSQKLRAGCPAIDHRLFLLEGILWLARTGAPSRRDLPPEPTNRRTAWRRLQRWTASGVRGRSSARHGRWRWTRAGWEARMLDSTVRRAHAYAAGARRTAGARPLWRYGIEARAKRLLDHAA